MIRPFKINDIPELLEMYNYFVLNSTATFDIEPLSLDAFTEKVTRIDKEYPFLVFEENNEILGYAYGSKFRPKPAYNTTVESTVYVKQNTHRKKIGSLLYEALLKQLKDAKFHVVLGVLTLPNDASVRLHEKFGFKQVGYLKQVGYKFDTWLDVGFYQLDLY
ncbi:GNAT family N-acetyltransferase [Gaetbulibacter aestuarii]|uniref:N-acetyltransferase family protein n=1 Tax=Gaetbulibacter aestuarii TaxID=1502358 RepID=A0ABW7MYR0_9FLAO